MTLPNIVLIVLDACRADHLSCYGYHRPTTPNIDRIARAGVLYKNAISPAVWTVPSHASLFTGMYISGHGLRGRNLKLRADVPTLASYLSQNGYITAAFTANTLVGNPTGLARGFQELKDMRQLIQGEDLPMWQEKINVLYRRLYLGVSPHYRTRYDSGAWRLNLTMKRWLKDWMKGDRKRPFFIFTNYMETHLPYVPPKAYRKRFLTQAQQNSWRKVNQNAWKYMSGDIFMTPEDFDVLVGLYDAELACVDMRIGQIYDFLAKNGVLDNTIFIITSDHGENLGEHNLMDHQYCVYDTLARVPLVIQYPRPLAACLQIEAQVQTVDIFPTLVGQIGRDDDSTLASLQGRSLLPEHVMADPREFTIIEYLAPQLHSFQRESVGYDEYFTRRLRALRTDRYKFIWASDGSHELYDLLSDPNEMNNLLSEQPHLAEMLQQQLSRWLRAYTRQDHLDETLDDQIVRRLEALGYVDV